MRTNNPLIILLLLGLFTACSAPKEISYFQDLPQDMIDEIAPPQLIVIQPGDKISIVVNCKDPQLSDLFNLPIVTHRIGQGEVSSLGSQSQQVSSYTVDPSGEVDFPILGKVHIAGKTRSEIADYIKDLLISNNLVKDPVVTVEFSNLVISVLGEVQNPGRFSVDRDKMTLLDAISRAGDLTIYGRRDNVLVLREEDGKSKSYSVNLCSAQELYASPVFYLRQNDVVYVEPNPVRVRQSTVNGNNVRSTSFWISLASLLTSISVLVFK